MEKRYQVIKPKHGFYKGECLDTDIAPTIDTGVGCWHTLIGESMEEIKCEPTEQRLEIGSEETSNTLTTVQKDNLVVEPNYRFFEQAFETLKENHCEVGDTIDAFNKRVNKDGISPTITTRPDGFKTAILPVAQDYRIRKLTERECFRLQGVKEEDFERVAKNQSTSSLYHLAGDSICCTCLMAIFGELFEIDYRNKINELVGELKQ